jgi:hypothetical protein
MKTQYSHFFSIYAGGKFRDDFNTRKEAEEALINYSSYEDSIIEEIFG